MALWQGRPLATLASAILVLLLPWFPTAALVSNRRAVGGGPRHAALALSSLTRRSWHPPPPPVGVGASCRQQKQQQQRRRSTPLTTTTTNRQSSISSQDALGTKRPLTVEKIAIVGGGIAGLTLAHALLRSNEDVQVTILEKLSLTDYQDAITNKGAGIQINGGLRVLHDVDPSLFHAVADAALPLQRVETLTAPSTESVGPEIRTLLQLDIPSLVRRQAPSLIVKNEENKESLSCCTIMRGTLLQILWDKLRDQDRQEMLFDKTLTGLSATEAGISCDFANGGGKEGPFDLVVGCDGIRSTVKEYVDSGNLQDLGRSSSFSIYSGLRIQYAIQDDEEALEKEQHKDTATFTQYFGDNAYGVTARYGSGVNQPRRRAVYLTFPDEDYWGPIPKTSKVLSWLGGKDDTTVDRNADAASIADDVGLSKTKDDDENVQWALSDNMQSIQQDMLRRSDQAHFPTESSDLRPILRQAQRFFELGVYFHSPFHTWSRPILPGNGSDDDDDCLYYCTLVGDAAHAMPPFLGQGANQAMQDAYLLAQQVAKYNTHKDEDMGDLLREYKQLRWWATTSITLKSIVLGYLESSGGAFRNALFLILGKLGVAERVFLDAAVPKVGTTMKKEDS